MRRFFKSVLTVFAVWSIALLCGSFLGLLDFDRFDLKIWALKEGAHLPDVAAVMYSIVLALFAVVFRLFYWIVDPKKNGDRERVKTQEIIMFYGMGSMLSLWFGLKVLAFSNPESFYLMVLMGVLPVLSLLLSGPLLKKRIYGSWLVQATGFRKAYVQHELSKLSIDPMQIKRLLEHADSYEKLGALKGQVESLQATRERIQHLENTLESTKRSLSMAKSVEEKDFASLNQPPES